MPEGKSIKVAAAKGRPMLSWVGKRPLREVRAFPAQLVERFSVGGSVSADVAWTQWPDRYERGGLLFHGDNKEVLAHLLANGFRGNVDLVYIDPPFDSGADYVRRVQLRGASGTARLDGENYTLGEQIQYTDIWANDTYLQFMYERLLLLKELLAESGSLWLHCDYRRAHSLRHLLDETMGASGFVNEIAWQRSNPHNDTQRFGAIHDSLFLYAKGEDYTFNTQFTASTKDYLDSHFTATDPDGRRYTLMPLTGQGAGPARRFGSKTLVPSRGRHWAWTQQRIDEAMASGLIVFTSGGVPRYKFYEEESRGRPLQSLWTDIIPINSQSPERLGFPTQKPEALVDRIIRGSSNPGDIVLDCFIGSGTTAAVAQKLGRRWIGADINKGAIQTTVKRVAGVMADQASATVSKQQTLLTEDDAAPRPPAQLSFTTCRVNDYDLAIQHNEAVNLACEHLGVERTKTEAFFDGVLGKRLVKIVPFNHPATPLDLQAAADELAQRPDEPRDALLVALGRELACEAWLEDYNRHRPINKIEIIELRSDPKYGHFFEHRPASARVHMEPIEDGRARVVIDDFVSPSILERLGQTEGVLAPEVTDWRSMVDSVMIDNAYDGDVLNVVLYDVPERKTDLVVGAYEVDLHKRPSGPVAVRITDMLGEEVLVVLEVGAPKGPK